MGTPIKPYYSDASKKTEVATMFNNIAKTYDFLNHFLSLGIDILWRKKAIACLVKDQPKYILDVATGTGDFAFEALSKLHPTQLIGIDISEGMLAIAQDKIIKRKEGHRMQVQVGDSENLVFEDHTFDAVTVSFGVRNFENLSKGLDSIYRVLKPGGKLVVLEFSNPKKFPIKQLYQFYSFKLLPIFGRLFSNDARAYTYLPESVKAFPDGAQFLAVMQRSGFVKSESKSLGMGICSIYIGVKN